MRAVKAPRVAVTWIALALTSPPLLFKTCASLSGSYLMPSSLKSSGMSVDCLISIALAYKNSLALDTVSRKADICMLLAVVAVGLFGSLPSLAGRAL